MSKNKAMILSAVITATITASPSILVAVVTTWPDDFRLFLTGPDPDNRLVGKWQGTWQVDYGPYSEDNPIRDVITITRVVSDKIYGSGKLEGRSYVIEGKDSELAVMLRFFGPDDKDVMAGVVLLEKKGKKNKLVLSGKWSQFGTLGAIVGGSVILSPL